MPTIAVFDFDKTLTLRDTLWPFMKFTHGQIPALVRIMPRIPILSGYSMGLIPRQQTKETMISAFYRGMPIELLRDKGREFAASHLNLHLRPQAIQRLRWHQSQGHSCILVSASLDIYLHPWAKTMGFDEIITSQLQVKKSGEITGLLKGNNCWGPEKTRRLSEVLGDFNQYTIYAYGDSRGDKELLEIADYPFYRRFN